MESLKRESVTYYQGLMSQRTEEKRREYVDSLYRSYFTKDGSVNTNKVKMDKGRIEEFLRDCREIKECEYGVERFSLLLQVV